VFLDTEETPEEEVVVEAGKAMDMQAFMLSIK
jgi:hypothetical protein